jgi:hypothetical protein
MEGSVLSFIKAEWKVSDTGSAHLVSSLNKIDGVVQKGAICIINYFEKNEF